MRGSQAEAWRQVRRTVRRCWRNRACFESWAQAIRLTDRCRQLFIWEQQWSSTDLCCGCQRPTIRTVAKEFVTLPSGWQIEQCRKFCEGCQHFCKHPELKYGSI
uniref:Uncharacterized protein n=1 Tax=Korle-bu Aedes virus TaxID=2605631 RepID=A0A679DYF4_9VIRU|nr:hypothetical protein 2 [Korle-bu Aedes virus]